MRNNKGKSQYSYLVLQSTNKNVNQVFKTYEKGKGVRDLWENPENRTKRFYGICFKILDFTLRENFDDYDCHYFPDSFSMVRILRILLVEVDRSGFQIRLSYSIAIRP